MALPNSYLNNYGKVEAYFDAILNAEAPERFSHNFLENLGFKSSNDRLLIGLLKDLGFLNSDGVPQQRYFEFLDRSKSAAVLADGLREGYSDLFAVNVNADEMSSEETKNKLRTLYAGSKTDLVIGRIAKTFEALCTIADFSSNTFTEKISSSSDIDYESNNSENAMGNVLRENSGTYQAIGEDLVANKLDFKSLQYHINIILPESRDQAVYDAIFKAMKEHLS